MPLPNYSIDTMLVKLSQFGSMMGNYIIKVYWIVLIFNNTNGLILII
jgi:hypothetical protein